MDPQIFPIGVGIIAAIMASYFDLFRGRVIPDKLTKPLIVVGILFYACWGLLSGDLSLALSGGIGAFVGFSIGYVLWITGGWAGGDVKLLTMFGALVPRCSPMLQPFYGTLPIFPLTIFFNSAIVSLPAISLFILSEKLKGRGAFYQRLRITQLREGAIPAEFIVVRNGKVFRGKGTFLHPQGDVLANPRRAAGLTKEQIRKLQELVRQGKLKDEIKIKKGIPYGPFLATGFIVGVLFGDLYTLFLFTLTS